MFIWDQRAFLIYKEDCYFNGEVRRKKEEGRRKKEEGRRERVF